MTEASDRFSLPFILPGQAQKEAYHNEALARIDAALHACIEGDPTADIPYDPAVGESWVVAPGAAGLWAGRRRIWRPGRRAAGGSLHPCRA